MTMQEVCDRLQRLIDAYYAVPLEEIERLQLDIEIDMRRAEDAKRASAPQNQVAKVA